MNLAVESDTVPNLEKKQAKTNKNPKAYIQNKQKAPDSRR